MKVVEMQQGHLDLGWVNMVASLASISRLEDQLEFLPLPIDLPEELGIVLRTLGKVRPILKAYKVDEQLSFMRTDGNRIIHRTIW